MLGRLDLRLRIAVVLATACIGLVGTLGATLYTAWREIEEALIEQLVSEEMEALIARTPDEPVPLVSGGANLQYYVVSEPDDSKLLPPALARLGPGQHEVGRGAEELRVAVRDIQQRRFLVVYDAGQHEVRATHFRNLMLLAIAVAAACAVALAYWLAGVLAKQLTELAAKVRGLAPDEPHPPLERPDHDREVAAVAHALDEYHARIVEMLQREQEFTANASHELRTPLTAIRTSCELLATERALSEKGRARLEMIELAVRQMTERIETLLYLAREHTHASQEAVGLRRCVEEAAHPYLDELGRKHLQFRIDIDTDVVLQTDRKALQIVLGNLIKNAVRYTPSGHVRVSYDGARISVADSGVGIPSSELPHVFDRHYRGRTDSAVGYGLGLAIVRRICSRYGWEIGVESEPGRGSSFHIAFAQ